MGFGLPTSLLNRTPLPASPLAIPPPPSFADFRFQSIGQQPNLLKRFSDPDPTQQSESSSISPEMDRPPADVEGNALPRNRPSLFQALTAEPKGAFAPEPTNQASSSFSQTAAANSTAVPRLSLRQSSSSSPFVQSAPSPNSPVHALSPKYSNDSEPTQSSHPSSSQGAVDQPLSDAQPIRSPDRPLVLAPTRRYDTLRQIQTRLQETLPKIGSPNLTSAMLLVDSAQQRTEILHNEAHHLHDLFQDITHRAQQGQATALQLIQAAEEAKGVADGAKAELDRISSKEAVQQRNADANEVRGLIQAVDDWIRNQEAAEAELRAKRIQQLKLKKQKSSVQTPSSTSAHSSTAVQPPLSSSTIGLPPANTPGPLFFSPTPEVDVKMEQTGSQALAVMPPAEQLRKRQADLRKKLEDKRRSVEAESRAESPLDATQLGQQQPEPEKRSMQVELKRKEEEERIKEELRKKLLEKRREEERRREEQALRDISARKKAEKAREEEAKKQREKEEVERKRCAEEEIARRATQKEMEDRAREKAEAEGKAGAVVDDQRKSAEARAAQAAEERKQAVVAFLSRQQEEKEKLRQVPAEQKRRQSQEALDKQKRLAEEQARMRAEQQREDALRQEQEKRRQQIQAQKTKTLVDRAQEIRAQRGHRPIPSQETTSEMSIDSSPQTTNIIIPDSSLSPLEHQVVSHLGDPAAPSSNTQPGQILPPLGPKNQSLSTFQQLTNGQKSVSSFNPVTPNFRQISLPPVDHLSPTDSASSHAGSVPLSQPVMSVYRHSSDGGNVPYREIVTTSPQAQAANLKPLLKALKLPTTNGVKVKPEPVPDDLTLSYPSEPSHGETSVQSSSDQTCNFRYQSTAARPLPLRIPSPVSRQSYQPSKQMSGLQANAMVSKPVSPPLIDAAARGRTQQVSESLQNYTNSPPEPRGETLQSISFNPARSESPFRMGPDPLEPRLISDEVSPTEFAHDRFSSQYPVPSMPVAVSQPPYRGRLPASNSASIHREVYLTAPPAPKGANVYRPNYPERSRSPAAGMKRARSPPSGPIIRDYRDYDERSVPMRRISRSPPPRRNRRPSRSPSPFYATDRPPLHARLDDTYRPSDSRDSYSSRPELLDRFTEPRSIAAPPPGRPGRGRGKRGRGGPPTGPSHASLEKRISSTTLMSRLEDPPRRS